MATSAQGQYKNKRDFWIECFNGKDRHCILNQIYLMVWNTAVFKVINEARRIAPPAKEGGVELSPLLHKFIDDCFFPSQMVGVRRLTDDSYGITGNRGVVSLISLIKDMRDHVGLMTRENIFWAQGLEYDYEAVRLKHDQYCDRMFQAGSQVFSMPEELVWQRLKERHEEIDVLCGVAEKQRSPGDSVNPSVFDKLKDKIVGACQDIHDHVNKFIAHAATPGSRQSISADTTSITLKHLWQAHEAICRAANFIDVYLLTGSNHSFVPVPQYNHLAYIEKPLVDLARIRQLGDIWDKYEKETHHWQPWKPEDIVK